MQLNRARTRLTRIAAGAACLTAITVIGATESASAAPADGMYRQLATLCGAAGGDFYPARFGYWRCQDARLDGMETFTSVRSLCERPAGRNFYEATHYPVVGRGTWVCGPA